MSREGFGKTKTGGNAGVKYLSLKTSKTAPSVSYTLRFLPAMKSLAVSGKWYFYHRNHFGWNGVNSTDPTKTRARPFGCLEKSNFKTKMVTHRCPACDLLSDKQKELDTLLARLKADPNQTDGTIEAATQQLKEWLYNHNADGKCYVNAMTEQGEFVCVVISNKMRLALETEFDKNQKNRNIDSTDLDQGVWYQITRSGYAQLARDNIEIVREEVKDGAGNRFERIKPAALTEDQITRALAECPDLALGTVKYLTDEQVKLIVQSSGDPEQVDETWAMGSKEASPRPETSPAPVKPAPKAVAAPVAVPVPVAVPAPAPAQDPQAVIAALMAQVAQMQQAMAVKAAPEAVAVAAPVAPVASKPSKTPPQGATAKGLTEDSFFNSFSAD